MADALPKTSFAMVLTAPKRLEPRELPLPPLDADSALLRVEVCGICGSDYEQFAGVLRTPTPVIPGHEPLGLIAAIGDRAAARWGVDVGDRVAVENMISCRFCAPCLGGRSHLCEKRKIYSYVPLSEPPALYGAYSQYLWLHPNSVVHKVSRELPAELAVMFNPLGAGFRWAVEIPELHPGESLVILGPGQRGLSSVLAARAAGAGTIIVTGLTADRGKLELAKRFGASHTIDVQQEDARKRIRELTGGRGADVVLDVSSYALEPVAQALDYVAAGGRIVLAGVKGFRPVPEFVSDKIVMKEIRISGAIGVTSTAYRNAIRLIESRTTPIAEMHTHDFPLADAAEAIRALEQGESIHSVLVPPS